MVDAPLVHAIRSRCLLDRCRRGFDAHVASKLCRCHCRCFCCCCCCWWWWFGDAAWLATERQPHPGTYTLVLQSADTTSTGLSRGSGTDRDYSRSRCMRQPPAAAAAAATVGGKGGCELEGQRQLGNEGGIGLAPGAITPS